MTSMMEQYFAIKNQYKDYLLFYRIGDFYEMFFEDAKIGSQVLDLTLTGRDWGEPERAPMCGIPFHAVDGYIGKLVSSGYKIAICEQLEDPALAKGLVKRDVIRIITPGTIVENSLLPENQNNFLASIMSEADAIGVAFCDISTGQLAATQFFGAERFGRLAAELSSYKPSEIITNATIFELGEAADLISNRLKALISPSQTPRYDYKACETLVKQQFGEKYSPDHSNSPITTSIGALLSYVLETQKTDLSYISELNVYSDSQYLEMDVNTRRNLELCETMRTKEKKGSLLWILDKTRTAMGARTLRKFVEMPLVNSYQINRRLDAVAELAGDFMLRADLIELLSPVLDLERLTTKLVYGSINARDLRAVAQSLAPIPGIKERISSCTSPELKMIYSELDDLTDMRRLIEESISDEGLPLTIKEGGIIRDGFHKEVDRLRSVLKNSKGILEELAEREREATKIKNLKLGYNRIFGYYIEVTKSFLESVPTDRYIRKQTLANCERFVTEELKQTEATILGAADRLNSLEYELFRRITEELSGNITRIKASASRLALIDAYVSLAETAAQNGYVRPEVNYGEETTIVEGRHPVVEKFVEGYFVPNDTTLNTSDSRMMLITGPNMAGKSTYMRQVALITVMAQIGSFVPAKEARIAICDKVFTRVGASDDLASGQSTFMLEMTECAHILKNATKRSLIIYDEIGRGTATFDGMSIAWAIAESTAKKIGAKTLFATHYHELCELEALPGVVNYSIAAKKRGDDITFLRKIVKGAADDSYGIEVAKLAGVPNDVIRRAKDILAQKLNENHAPAPKKEIVETPEISFEDVLETQLAETVRSIDLNTLTPIEALNKLYDLKRLIGD